MCDHEPISPVDVTVIESKRVFKNAAENHIPAVGPCGTACWLAVRRTACRQTVPHELEAGEIISRQSPSWTASLSSLMVTRSDSEGSTSANSLAYASGYDGASLPQKVTPSN